MISTIWLASQITVILIFAWVATDKDIEWSKDLVLSMLAMVIFGPISLLGLFILWSYETTQDKKRLACTRIMSQWENKSRANSLINSWDWYTDRKKQEQRIELLREHIDSVSDKDLKLLASVGKNTYDIDKLVRDAIVDEMIERSIMAHNGD